MRIFVFFTLLLAIPVLAYSQSFDAVGVRAEGMGGAFVAVADDASAAYWNPAGLAMGATFDFQISGGLTPIPVPGSDPNGTNFFLGVGLPVLGLSFYRTHTVQAAPDRQNVGSGRVPVRLLATSNVGVTVVQTVVPNVVIGTTARVLWGGFEGFPTRSTGDFDAGAMVSAGSVRIGITGRNLRQPEFETEGGTAELKRHVRLGAALAPRSLPSGVHGPFSLAFDVDLTTTPSAAGEGRRAAVGGEYWIGAGRIGLRAGVNWSSADSSERASSGGLTVRLPKSIHVEGQITKPSGDGDSEWLIGARITF
jgi:hypothetical protein